jgi:hypothetical protein
MNLESLMERLRALEAANEVNTCSAELLSKQYLELMMFTLSKLEVEDWIEVESFLERQLAFMKKSELDELTTAINKRLEETNRWFCEEGK